MKTQNDDNFGSGGVSDNDNDHFGSNDNNFESGGEVTCLCQNLNSVVSKLGDAELRISEQNCDQNDSGRY